MDNRLKQRLIGAFVIVVLAVIFVPYLLEEPAEPEEPVANLESPPRPESDFTERASPVASTDPENMSEAAEEPSPTEPELPEIELMGLQPRSPVTTVDITEAEAPESEQAARIEAERARLKAERAERARVEAAQAERARAEAERARVEAARAERARAEAERARAEAARAERARAEAERAERARAEAERARKEAKPEEIALPKIELIGRPTSEGGTGTPPPPPLQTAAADRFGWLVQAGSFSRRNNAYELRDRLRNLGFNAFIEDSQESGRTLYRVRIGPQLSRAESENILARLRRETGINGLVLSPE